MVYRRKRKAQVPKREVIAEPSRTSILDVVLNNLRIANRVTCVHRLLYIGEHAFEGNQIIEVMEKNFKQSNSGYVPEGMSGILLFYQGYFCTIVEGSEEVLNKHLALLFKDNEENLSNVKLLSAVHHVKGRFWHEWMSYNGRPAGRVEEIDPESDLDNSMRYVMECAEKLYNFANFFIADQQKSRSKLVASDDEDTLVESEKSSLTPEDRSVSVHRSIAERDPYTDYIPEVKLLQFLVNCKHLKDLRDYHDYYEYIGQSADYSLKAWPTPSNLIPYDVFDKPYDPISDLPTPETATELSKDEVESTDDTSHLSSIQ